MLSDPIADMLTRIRNALMANKDSVNAPASQFKEEILKLLAREGYIRSYEHFEQDEKPAFRVNLKYGPRRQRVIQHIRRISRPGRRVYVSAKQVSSVRHGLGIAIVSTSKGLLLDREARRLGVGGELICEVW